jgi:hypothetical protein
MTQALAWRPPPIAGENWFTFELSSANYGSSAASFAREGRHD